MALLLTPLSLSDDFGRWGLPVNTDRPAVKRFPGRSILAVRAGKPAAIGIIFLISLFLDDFLTITWIAHAFMGIKIAVGILIVDAAVKMIRKMKKKPLTLAFLICAFLAMLVIDIFALRISSITLMLTAGVISLAIFAVGRGNGMNGRRDGMTGQENGKPGKENGNGGDAE